MASLIPGYKYDIFISYRQKDNKHDGWVTEFVNNLKGELESTFKEEISVYFDINPHDGLLETHDVDESLKEKLKCLIFIPIISRTYCDPKSFAWEHEFKAFVEMASKDNYGLKVKLQDGNVSNRVLPVQIHDLDADDKRIIENVLGGFLRGIEFIYKEPGVDRPLKPKDNEEKNLHKTSYQNQINKTALAIREIITAIKHHNQQHEEVLKENIKALHASGKNRNKTFIFVSITALVIIILALILILKPGKPSEHPEKSLAVLPFRNDSPDPENEYFCNGMMEEILNQLQKISDLKVKARTSSEKYRNPDKDIRTVGRELGVSLILEGSVRKIANDIRITAQLIDAKTGDHLWSEIYDGKYTTEIFDFQSSVAKKVASSLNAVITPQEEKRIDTKPTTKMLAYDLISRGNEMIRKFRYNHDSSLIKIALNLFDQASEIDTTYSGAIGSKTLAYIEISNYDSAIYYCRKSMKNNPDNPGYYRNMGRIYSLLNQPDSAFKYVQIAVDLAPNDCWTNLLMGQLYSHTKNELIKGLPYYQKAYDNDGESSAEVNNNIAIEYILIGDYRKASKYYRKALLLRTECPLIMNYCLMLNAQGKYDEALHSLDSACSIAACDQICDMTRFYIYLFNNESEKAEECFLKSVNAGYKQNDSDAAFIASLYKETGKKKDAAEIATKSIELNKSLMTKDVSIGMIAYRTFKLACACAVLDDNKNAIRYLSEYERFGFFYWNHMIGFFPGFSILRDDPEFKAVIRRIEDKQASLREKVRQMEMRGEITL